MNNIVNNEAAPATSPAGSTGSEAREGAPADTPVVSASAEVSTKPQEVPQSLSIKLRPCDSRCQWWAKIIRSTDTKLPAPRAIGGAGSLPQGYSRRGDEELYPGDFVIEGEANHHRKQRGWTYWLHGLDASGREIWMKSGQFSTLKPRLKQAGLEPSLLAGAGDIAAAVRVIHAVRAGIDVHHLIKTLGTT